jgi:hypothetical protein
MKTAESPKQAADRPPVSTTTRLPGVATATPGESEGRRPSNPARNPKKTKYIKLRVTESEYDQAVANTKPGGGLTMVIRACVLTRKRRRPPIEAECFRLLAAWVSTLNHIARQAVKIPDPPMVCEVIAHLTSLERQVNELVSEILKK